MPSGQQVLSAEQSWYASGTFWTIVGIAVAIALGSWAVWAAFRAARPRRALYISVDQSVPLLRSAPGLRGRGLAVTLEGRPLTAPHVVTVDVVSHSALDIAPAAFGDAPLELEFGVPILALLDQTSDAGRAGVREPAVVVRDTALHVGPALLTRRHRLRYTVLLDGRPEFRPLADLVDVTLEEGLAATRPPDLWLAFGTACATVVLSVNILGFFGSGWLTLGVVAALAVGGFVLTVRNIRKGFTN